MRGRAASCAALVQRADRGQGRAAARRAARRPDELSRQSIGGAARPRTCAGAVPAVTTRMHQHKHAGGAHTPHHGAAADAVPGKRTLTQDLPATAAASTPDPSKTFYDEEVTALAASGRALERDVVDWNAGLDLLSAGKVRAAGEQAGAHFLDVERHAAALGGSPYAAAAQHALAWARQLVAQLGLFHYGGLPLDGRAVAFDDKDAPVHIGRSIERAERVLADANKLYDLCQGGKVAGTQLDPAVRFQIATLVRHHAEIDEEARWIAAFVRSSGINRTVFTMGTGTDAEQLVGKLFEIQADEAYFASIDRDVDAKQVASIDADADDIVDYINDGADGARYVAILRKYDPKQRAMLLHLLG